MFWLNQSYIKSLLSRRTLTNTQEFFSMKARLMRQPITSKFIYTVGSTEMRLSASRAQLQKHEKIVQFGER